MIDDVLPQSRALSWCVPIARKSVLADNRAATI
jgi:hypothetical protein